MLGVGAAAALLKSPPVVAPEAAGRLGAGAVVALRACPIKIKALRWFTTVAVLVSR